MVEYKCKNCGKKKTETEDANPECCGEPMQKMSLDLCTQPSHAEHTRPMESEDACDDGRAG